MIKMKWSNSPKKVYSALNWVELVKDMRSSDPWCKDESNVDYMSTLARRVTTHLGTNIKYTNEKEFLLELERLGLVKLNVEGGGQ